MGLTDETITQLMSYGTVSTCPADFPSFRGHEAMAKNLVRHLLKSNRKSFVLVGESGVGKTTVLQTAFRELTGSEGGDWSIVETSTAEILRGTKYIGEWETRLTNLASLATVENGVILFVTDIQNLRGAGRSANDDSNMADAFSPFIERGNIILIGECTPEAYRRGIETTPAIHKQVTAFQVSPTEEEETAKMVRFAFEEISAAVEEETDVSLELPDTTVSSLGALGGIYFPGTAQPGAAIDLLRKTVEFRCEEFEDVASERPRNPVELTHSDIVYALHCVLGLPLGLLDDDIALNLKETREFFEAHVIGQNEAIATIVDVITMIKAGLTDPGKPNSVMLFAGPTGVGKTELAKALASFLFGSKDRMIRCDMSEYKDYNAFEKLLGRPGADSDVMNPSASLVTRVRRQPFSVILLDEIEKAHPNVFDVLLQAFDDGRLSDPEGRTTDLTQTIIIMTSNLGSDLARPKPVGFDSEAPDSSEIVDKALRTFFRPEFINRIDHVVRFRSLERSHIRTLARRELGMALMRNGLLRRELRVDVDRNVYDLLATKGYDELYGARPLRRQVEKLAVLPVARRIVNLGKEERGSLLRLDLKDGEISVGVVRDRQTRTAERITRGIEVVDPIDGEKSKVKPSDVVRELEHFAERLESLETRCAEEKIAERKSELLENSGAIDFWDDQEKARETLGEIYRLDRLLEAVEKTKNRHGDLCRKYEAMKRGQHEEALRKLTLDLRAAGHFLELVRFGLECRNREDRRDAFVAIRLVDETAESDLVAKLGEAYQHWAKRKGYGIRLVHEESAGKNLTREVVMEITGPAVFGILRGEEGEHEFVFGKTSRLPRRNRFVSVRVLGTPVKDLEVDIQIRKKAVKETAKLSDHIRTLASAADRHSEKSVELLSPLGSEEAEEAAINLLRSEIDRHKNLANEFSESVIRKYFLSPVAEIKDHRAPGIEIKARDFWKGELDEVLHAGIEARLAESEESACVDK